MRSEASVAYRRSSADRAASGTIWPFFPSFIFLPFFQSYATAYIPISLALSQHWKTTKTNTLDTNTSDSLLLLELNTVIWKSFARSSVRTSAYIADHGRLSHSSRRTSCLLVRYQTIQDWVRDGYNVNVLLFSFLPFVK